MESRNIDQKECWIVHQLNSILAANHYHYQLMHSSLGITIKFGWFKGSYVLNIVFTSSHDVSCFLNSFKLSEHPAYQVPKKNIISFRNSTMSELEDCFKIIGDFIVTNKCHADNFVAVFNEFLKLNGFSYQYAACSEKLLQKQLSRYLG